MISYSIRRRRKPATNVAQATNIKLANQSRKTKPFHALADSNNHLEAYKKSLNNLYKPPGDEEIAALNE